MATQIPAEIVINWSEFEAEILKYCVDQNHSFEQTQAYMRQKFGLKATVTQYKKRYSGYKNLKVSEWAGVSKAYSRRSQQGKKSELWVKKRVMDPAKVSQQLARYKAQFPPEDGNVATPALDPRLSVRTPPPTAIVIPLPLSVGTSVGIRLENGVGDLNESLQTMVASPPLPEIPPSATTEQSPAITEEDMDLDIIESMTLFPFQDCDFFNFDFFDDAVSQRTKLLDNLPWFQLYSVLWERDALNHPSLSSTSISRSSSALVTLTVADRQALLAGLLGLPSEGTSATAAQTLTAKLSEVLPEHRNGELTSAVGGFLDPTNKDPMQDLFKFACYFFANNILGKEQRVAFMRWVMQKNHTKKLAEFLGIPSPGVDGFRHGVIAAIIDMEELKLVLLLVQSGVCFNEVLAQSTGVKSEKFFKNLIEYGLDKEAFRQLSDEELVVRLLNSPVSPDLLSGKPGGRLLQRVVDTGHSKACQILIQNGCDLDTFSSEPEKLPTRLWYNTQATPLWLAVERGHIRIVRYLVEAGAKLDLSISTKIQGTDQPLALAVRQGRTEVITALVEGGASLNCRISGRDIFQWSSENNAKIYRHLCTLTGRDMEKSKKLTVDMIVEEANRSPDTFRHLQSKHGANFSDQLLEEALMSAVEKEMFNATSTLLSAGVDPNAPRADRQKPPMCHTLWYEPPEYNDPDYGILQLLLDWGADPNHEEVVDSLVGAVTDGTGFRVFEMILNGGLDVKKYGPRLLVEATGESIDIVAALVEIGVSPNSYSRSLGGNTALQVAAAQGNIELVEYFLQRGGDVNKPASRFRGQTALQAACGSNRMQMVRYLLDKGADANAPPSMSGGSTALEASLHKSHPMSKDIEIFELLLENGTRIDQPPNRSGRILRGLIDKCAEQTPTRHVSLVLGAGANPSEMSTDESAFWSVEYEGTAVQLAAERGSLDLVKLLVSHDGDVNQPAWRMKGRTALQAAASRKSPEIELVRYLLEREANVNAPPAPNGGLTALQGAAIRGHVNIVLLLLEHGADPNARRALVNGRTALEGAAEHGRLDMVKLLLNAGARPDPYDTQAGFKKAIELAEKNRHFVVAELLRSHERELGNAGI